MKYLNEMKDPRINPEKTVLKDVLGRSYSAYSELLKLFEQNEVAYEWRFYNDVKAWLGKATKKKKTIVWMSPGKGYLRATIYFQNKYVNDLCRSGISAELKKRLQDKNDTRKSKACTFEIKNKSILKEFITVINYKLSLK